MGSPRAEGAACEVEGAPRCVREAARRRGQREARQGRDPHSARPAPGRRRDRGQGRVEGLRRPLALREPDVLVAARGHRRRDRPERRRQDDVVPDDLRPGDTGFRRPPHRRHGAVGLRDQSRADLDPKSTVWKEISGGQDIVLLGRRRSTRASTRRGSTSVAGTSRSPSASSRAASAIACTWRRC